MRKRIIQLLRPAAILTAACLSPACADNNAGKSGGDGETTIELTLKMPATTGGAATRAITGEPFEENEIVAADVLAFIYNGTDWVYDYKATTISIEDTELGIAGVEKTITATVRELSVQQIFAIFANSADEVEAIGYIVPGTKMEDVERKIINTNGSGEWPAKINGSSDFTPFPMYARTEAETIHSGTNTIGLYPMIRMVARIDVALHDTIPSSNFKLTEACLYNRMTRGYVSYGESGFDDNVNAATTPAVPAGGNTGTPPLAPSVTYTITANKIERTIYTFEAEAITNEAQRTERTALVIGGYYNNSPTMSYYRIDLKDKNLASGNISDGILRNHLYKVEVQSVAGVGYTTAESAYMGDARLTAVVTAWNLAEQNVIGDGIYKLDVEMDTKGVFRRWIRESTLTTVKAKTNYDIGYQGFSPGIYVVESKIVYDPAVNPGDEWIIFTPTHNGDGSLTREFTLEIDRRKVPDNCHASIAKIPVTAGNMTKMVYMEFVNEYYPEPHTGWAGSNIYWNGSKLTFDDEGITTHELHQGLLFQWGSLYAISPKGVWSDKTLIYTPDGSSDTAASKGFSSNWENSPWLPRVGDDAITNNPPAGKSKRDRAYLYELSADNGALAGTGDICKYMTEKGWAPAGKWRMPTSTEFEDKDKYSIWISGGFAAVDDHGTAVFNLGRNRVDATPYVFLPASGVRQNDTGNPEYTGLRCYYWSASPDGTNSYCMYFLMDGNPNLSKLNHRAFAHTVRCVKE